MCLERDCANKDSEYCEECTHNPRVDIDIAWNHYKAKGENEAVYRDFYVPEGGSYPEYYILCSSSEPSASLEKLRERKIPYYYSAWNPIHVLARVQSMTGKTESKLESCGLERVNLSQDAMRSLVREHCTGIQSIDLDGDDEDDLVDDHDEYDELVDGKNEFIDYAMDGRVDDALEVIDALDRGIENVEICAKLDRDLNSVSVSSHGVIVVDFRDSDARMQNVDDIVKLVIDA
jgi:hypothetical protein